jgi:hypothetical protein
MPSSKIVDINPENLERVIQAVNHQYDNMLDLEATVRKLETRIDNFVPTSMYLSVVPASKIVWAAAFVGAAMMGYLAYTEVRRSNKSEPSTRG